MEVGEEIRRPLTPYQSHLLPPTNEFEAYVTFATNALQSLHNRARRAPEIATMANAMRHPLPGSGTPLAATPSNAPPLPGGLPKLVRHRA